MFRFLSKFGKWYSQILDRKPLMTQAITSGLLTAAGDVTAQIVEAKLGSGGDHFDRYVILLVSLLSLSRLRAIECMC
jgi:hypothetical protein